jgi:hypothetical protein
MGQIINQYLFFFIISMTHKSEDYKISAVKNYFEYAYNLKEGYELKETHQLYEEK